jgi:hypothetical protein
MTRGPRVGVVDSGWPFGLNNARVEKGISFVVPSREPGGHSTTSEMDDECGHGTACAQIILSVSPTATVVPIRIFAQRMDTTPGRLFAALRWASLAGLDVLNLSLATVERTARDELYGLCEQLRNAGTVVVAAARNNGSGGYPAVFDNAIGVTLSKAVIGGRLVRIAPAYVDLMVAAEALAPFLERLPRRPIASTSLAAAFVSGHVALLLQQHGPMSFDALRESLTSSLTGLRSQ